MVLAYGYATQGEIDQYRPGSDGNPGSDTFAWVYFWSQLGRLMGREELQERRAAVADADADAKLLAALSNAPLPVELVARDSEGKPRVVQVYPKSFLALLFCRSRDQLLGRLGQALLAVEASPDRVIVAEWHDRLTAEIGYQYALLSWAVTHPGAYLPFEPDTQFPDVPALHLALDVWDHIRIARTFAVVNAARLEALPALVDPGTPQDEPPGRRPSYSVFVSHLAEQKGSAELLALLRDRSLASLLAERGLQAHTHERARLRAEQRRRPRRTPADEMTAEALHDG